VRAGGGPRHIDWVVLDLGETLVDETGVWTAWAQWLGVPVFTFFAEIGAALAERRPHTDAIEHFRPGVDLSEQVRLKEAAGLGWALSYDDLYPDALPTLVALKDAGYSVAVFANQPLVAESLMSALPLDRYASSARWEVEKPDPAFFARISSELGTDPATIAYVGDRVDNDVLPAKVAGMFAVHLVRGPWGHIHSRWPEARDADLSIPDLAALVPALATLTD
jgi:FMN phosphatase YigB (HAD superfamily)